MTPVGKGCWLGIANVFVVALVLSRQLRLCDATLTFAVVLLCGVLPAVVVGTCLGWMAEATAADRPWWRIGALAVPALGLVGLLANVFDLLRFVPHASIPTLLAASLLERTTRTAPSSSRIASVRVGLRDG